MDVSIPYWGGAGRNPYYGCVLLMGIRREKVLGHAVWPGQRSAPLQGRVPVWGGCGGGPGSRGGGEVGRLSW